MNNSLLTHVLSLTVYKISHSIEQFFTFDGMQSGLFIYPLFLGGGNPKLTDVKFGIKKLETSLCRPWKAYVNAYITETTKYRQTGGQTEIRIALTPTGAKLVMHKVTAERRPWNVVV